MRKIFLFILFILLVIAPALPMVMEPTDNYQSTIVPNDVPKELLDDMQAPDAILEDDVELDMMFFTETALSENGLYYVCRRGTDAVAYFGTSMVKYLSGGTVFTLEFPGSRSVVPHGERPTGSVTNYMYGNDPSKWKTGIEDCAALRYPEIYPGIDLVYKVQDGNLKYEFVVGPYSNPQVIKMEYSDADSIRIDMDGVTVSREGNQMADTKLKVYQQQQEKVPVGCKFHLENCETIIFILDVYNPALDLIIDPINLFYSTYIGGSSTEYGRSIAVEDGSIYITGETGSADFPMKNAYNSTFSGGSFDCFVTKLASDGQSLIYSTFMGGSSGDYGNAIAVEYGCAYITGHTYSPDFPMVNAYNDTYTTGPTCFVTKFSADGQSLVYSTFLGGGGMHDLGRGIAVESGYAYVTGSTKSSDFPTVDAYDADYNGGTDCFLTKFAIDGQSLIYSTYIGHSDDDYGLDIAVEDTHAYISGSTSSSGFPTQNAYDSSHNGQPDCFVVKFAADGQSLNYSSFLGGSDHDYGYAIAVEDGYAYVTGHTYSGNFPRVNAYDLTLGGTRDCFVTKFSKDGQSLNYSTYLGGSDIDYGEGIAVDAGYAYVTGKTDSSDFPLVEAYDSNYNSDGDDCFVTKFALDGKKLIYSTYLGGSYDDCGNDIAVENGYQYIVGETRSPNFPTVDAYEPSLHGSRDCFIAIFSPLDSDFDGLSDEDEERYGTNPHCIDTDNDNFLDGYEIAYGTNATDPADFPAMPQAWYDAIYEDLDGNATLIQQIISWLDGNHTAIETLFTYVEGNATLLLQTVNALDGNATELILVAALATSNYDWLTTLNATTFGNFTQIREVMDLLGATIGDADYDGLDDLDELARGTDFQCIDTDCDNLNDAFEVKIGTDPLDDDSDSDTYLDGIEVLAGTDPLDANDYPGAPDESSLLVLMIVIASAGIGVTVVIVLVLRKRRGAS